MRTWAMLMKLDTSITHSPGNTWATEKTLPTDFSSAYKLFGGDSDNEYLPVPFTGILKYKSSANRYTIDLANLKMRLTGSPSSALTMYLWYQYAPTSLFGLSDAAKALTTTIVWPARFRPLLAYDMAALFFGGLDADEITNQMAPEDKAAAAALEKAMIAWDNRNMAKMMDNSSSPQPINREAASDVVSW